MPVVTPEMENAATWSRAGSTFLVALRLGLTSFGGPIAHLGYFRHEYVTRRHWIDDGAYADLVALCQVLPGPTSSQVGMAIGMMRAGWLGALAAWLGFTLPSATALTLFALVVHAQDLSRSPAIHGLLIVAGAVVAQAVWGMARTLAPDRERGTVALVAAAVILLWPGAWTQVVIIACAGLIGWRLLPSHQPDVAARPQHMMTGARGGLVALGLFGFLLVALPLLRDITRSPVLAVIDSFYRSGALVFGGGHVVLPLLQREVVPPGWVTNVQFLAGYGAAQAVPGPLFTFAAYLGAARHSEPNGVIGALLATVAIFLPSLLLIAGILPFWQALYTQRSIAAALRVINAAVVGLLLAALYQPVWTSAVRAPADAALAAASWCVLALWKLPVWSVVLLTVLGSVLLSPLIT